jgi:hypothetical protein
MSSSEFGSKHSSATRNRRVRPKPFPGEEVNDGALIHDQISQSDFALEAPFFIPAHRFRNSRTASTVMIRTVSRMAETNRNISHGRPGLVSGSVYHHAYNDVFVIRNTIEK